MTFYKFANTGLYKEGGIAYEPIAQRNSSDTFYRRHVAQNMTEIRIGNEMM